MEGNKEATLPDLEVRDVLGVEPRQIRVFRDERNQVRLTLLDDRSYLQVRAMSSFPLSDPAVFVGLADGKNKQICMVRDLSDLDPESRAIVRELLDARYFAPRITRVLSTKDEFGVLHWSVETDRGAREFYIRNLRDTQQDLPNNESLIVDVDGNRFVLPALATLDKESRARAQAVM